MVKESVVTGEDFTLGSEESGACEPFAHSRLDFGKYKASQYIDHCFCIRAEQGEETDF